MKLTWVQGYPVRGTIMNHLKQYLIGLLCIGMFLSCATAKVSAIDTAVPTEEAVKAPETLVGEVIDKREVNIKTFLTSDFRYQAYIYPNAVHYQVNGEFEDIDNRLVESKSDNTLLENTANSFKIKFAKNTNASKIVSFSSGSLGFSWGFVGLNKTFVSVDNNESRKTTQITDVSNTQSMALYPDAFLNTDIQYYLDGDQIKENFILKAKGAPTSFTQTISIQQGSVIEENGRILFKDKDGVTQYVMGDLSMSDASGEFSRAVSFTFTKTIQGIDLTITADSTWINDPSRVYPITIDPSVQTSVDRANMEDCHVSNNYPNTNYYQSYILKSGWKSNSLSNQTYLRFTLPELTSADLIVSATLQMFVRLDESDPTNVQVNVYEVDQDWDENTLTWNNKPTNSNTIEDYDMVSSNEFVYWDITRLTRQWYLTKENNGVVVKNENQNAYYKEYYSAETNIAYATKRPLIVVTYVNNNGLEDLWTYTTQDLGRAGTAFVNNGSGNLVITRNDLSVPGGKMPVSITSFFSNENRNSATMGWKTNYEQTIALENINNVNYYGYTDADGTKVYFYLDPISGKWIDELNKGLELTFVAPTDPVSDPDVAYIITDRSENTLEFDRGGYLVKLKDNAENPNFITIEYTTDTSKKISVVTDSSGRKYNYVYSTEEGNDVIVIDYADVDANVLKLVKYTFNTTDHKMIVKYSDQMSVSYDYDPVEGFITKVTDIDETFNAFTYSTKDPKVISTMTEYGESTGQQAPAPEYKVGSVYTFSYSQNETEITDRNGNKVTYQFDNYGRTICIKDANNAAQYYEYGALGGEKNRLTSVSKLQTTTINLAKNISFEASTDWLQIDSVGTLNTPIYTTTSPLFGTKSLSITHSGSVPRTIYAYENIPVSISSTDKVSYTLSAYVKSSAVGAAHLSISINGASPTTSTDVKVDTANAWQRISSTINITGQTVTSLQIRLVVDANATVQFDGVQFEKGVGVNRFNLVENPSLEYTTTTVPTGWTATGTSSSVDLLVTDEHIFNTKSYKITGSATGTKTLSQTIAISGTKDDVFSYGGWAKAITAAKLSGRSFGMSLKFNYTDTSTETKYVSFNSSAYTWQYAQGKAIATKDYTSVVISFDYIKQVNEVFFDGAQVYREEFGKTFSYDEQGNLVASKDLTGNSNSTNYDSSNQLISQTNPDGSYVSYDYDNFHRVTAAQSSTGVSTKITYDVFGNPITTTISNAVFGNKLIAYYKFDGDLEDSSGNNHDATNAGVSDFQPGKVNQGIQFNGTDQYIELGNFKVPDSFSISMWVKNERLTNECIIGKNTANGTGNQILFGEYNSKITTNIASVGVDFGTKTLGYQFLVGTYEKIDESTTHVKIYKDTVLIYESYFNGLIGDTSTGKPWAVGMEWDYVSGNTVKSDFFKGTVDELAFFEGALDETEINAIYAQANTKQVVALFDFALVQGSTNRLLDKSGNGHNATSVGTVSYTNDKLNLSGSGYIQLDDFYIGQDLTVSMVVKPNSISNFSLFAKHDAAGNNILIEGYYSGLHTRIRDNTQTGNALTVGVTKTIVYTIKRINETQSRVQIYVDGVAQLTNTVVTGVLGDTTGKPWVIGQEWDGSTASDYFSGTIDNLAIYNYEMSSTEVSDNLSHLTLGDYDPNTDVYSIFGEDFETIVSSATYTADGNYITSVTDSRGNVSSYDYDSETGTLSSFKSPTDSTGEETYYTYDENSGSIKEVKKTVNSVDYINEYTYAFDKLASIKHNSFFYNFTYDSFNRPDQVLVGSVPLITNSYDSTSGLLNLLTYGNNDTVNYSYDEYQRVIRKVNNDGLVFRFTYDNEGNFSSLTRLQEAVIGQESSEVVIETTHYYYDFLSRPVKSVNTNGLSTIFTYDNLGRVSALTNTIASTSGTTTYRNEYVYGDQYIPGQIPGQIYNVKLNGTTQLSYAFDQLARLTSRKIGTTNDFTTNYTYLDIQGTSNTTTLLESIKNGTNDAYIYMYDANGNILKIKEGTSLKATYTYDKLNQLISEDNIYTGLSIDYVYDQGGNIVSRTEFALIDFQRSTLLRTFTYTYFASWKDQLKSISCSGTDCLDNQNTEIVYDNVGNPTTYYNGATLSWQNGRELASYEVGTVTTTYKYNDSGIRTSKQIGTSAATTYYLNGDKIVRQTNGTLTLDFFYDENGNLYGFKDNGVMYYYLRNGQNDIIGILNNSGVQVVSYTYDSWGNLIEKTGTAKDSIGADNPFRYRGYYFDSDTGLYYLNSRYYDSKVGRFINADGLVSTSISLLGTNMYSYCENNSVNKFDLDGRKGQYYRNYYVNLGNLEYRVNTRIEHKGKVYYFTYLVNTLGAIHLSFDKNSDYSKLLNSGGDYKLINAMSIAIKSLNMDAYKTRSLTGLRIELYEHFKAAQITKGWDWLHNHMVIADMGENRLSGDGYDHDAFIFEMQALVVDHAVYCGPSIQLFSLFK